MTSTTGSAVATDESGRRTRGSASSTPVEMRLLLIFAGVLLGGVNALANYGHLTYSPYVSKVVGNDWAWLTLGYLSARFAMSTRQAFNRALLVLGPAVATYYLADWPLFHHAIPDVIVPPTGFILGALIWAVVATATSGGLAAISGVARLGGLIGATADAVVPGFIAWTAYRSHRFQVDIPQGADLVLRDVTAVIWPSALAITVGVLINGLAVYLSTRRSEDH